MRKNIPAPALIKTDGDKPTLILELAGRASKADSRISIAHMHYPSDWVEPDQTLEFDEFMLVLKGELRIAYENGALTVRPGQAALVFAGKLVRYSTPRENGAEYIVIRLPALSSLNALQPFELPALRRN